MSGFRRFLAEFLWFGIKQARACLFAGLFFLSVFAIPRARRHRLIAACVLGLYARSVVTYRPLDRDRHMPLLLSFLLIGFFLWVAENISTFIGIWRYPDQLGAWSAVHLGKWSSWSLLVIMTFTIIGSLKHVKATIHIPE